MRNRGFTLIELLITMVIVGLLAAIAMPLFRNQRDRAVQASMISDLASLAKAQEGYYYNNGVYAPDVVTVNVNLSPGNSLVINEATTSGWSATLVHVPTIGKTCYIYYGGAIPVGSTTSEGVVSCS